MKRETRLKTWLPSFELLRLDHMNSFLMTLDYISSYDPSFHVFSPCNCTSPKLTIKCWRIRNIIHPTIPIWFPITPLMLHVHIVPSGSLHFPFINLSISIFLFSFTSSYTNNIIQYQSSCHTIHI